MSRAFSSLGRTRAECSSGWEAAYNTEQGRYELHCNDTGTTIQARSGERLQPFLERVTVHAVISPEDTVFLGGGFLPPQGERCARVIVPKNKFDSRSFRWKRSGKGRVLIGCPKGEWDAHRVNCRVGTRAHVVVKKRDGDSCPRGYKER